jgi:large subunit ribosomal protein L35
MGSLVSARVPLFFLTTKSLTMPKLKTHKGSKKRFRVTASGHLKRSQAGKKHLNSPKTGKRKRQLRAKVIEEGRLAKRYVTLMGGA